VQLVIDLAASPAATKLVDPDELRSFAVVVVEPPHATWPEVVARREEHVWVRIDALRALAPAGLPPDWGERFDAMIAFARERGWVDESAGAVRGHVERRASRPGARRRG
jgi:hypothetical protein